MFADTIRYESRSNYDEIMSIGEDTPIVVIAFVHIKLYLYMLNKKSSMKINIQIINP